MSVILAVLVLVGSADVKLPAPLVLCGGAEVFVVDHDPKGGSIGKTWSWRASHSREIPKVRRRWFATTDECKPLAGGKRLLVTSSSGGVAIIERATKKVTFLAHGANAHSAELLPRYRVVVACSTHRDGNELRVFDLANGEQAVFETPLVSAHGVVWDPGRRRLWALGLDELRTYSLADWDSNKPRLVREKTYRLPSSGGHDLVEVPARDELLVTTSSQVLVFDRSKGTFRPHPQIGEREHVKGVTIDARTGRLAWVAAEDGRSWSSRVRFLPKGELELEGERLYKARWLR